MMMLILYTWLLDHPNVNLEICGSIEDPDSLIFVMTEKHTKKKVTFTIDIVYYSSLSVDDDYKFIFNSMYDELMGKYKVGTMEA